MSESSHPFYKILFTTLFCGLLVYGVFNTRFLIKGPELVLAEIAPKESLIQTDSSHFVLKGTVTHSTFISINDRPITIDEEGNFAERFLLSDSINTINILARDKFGKETQRELKIVYTGISDSLAALTKVFETEVENFLPEDEQTETETEETGELEIIEEIPTTITTTTPSDEIMQEETSSEVE